MYLIHRDAFSQQQTAQTGRVATLGYPPRNCLPQRYDCPPWTDFRLIGHKQENLSDHRQDSMSLLRSFSDQLAIHSRTPGLVVSDPRGLAVRGISYYRRQASAAAQPYISAQWHDAAARPIAQWDPRQFDHFQAGLSETPNQSTVFSLSGVALRHHNADAGCNVVLQDVSTLPHLQWNSRQVKTRFEYDSLARLVAIVTDTPDGQSRISQRLTYAPVDPVQAAVNRCGTVCRRDDDAGSHYAEAFSIAGEMISHTQHFLIAEELPDWPAAFSDRNALLEPGPGYQTRVVQSALGQPLSSQDAAGNVHQWGYDISGAQNDSRLVTAAGATSSLLLAIDHDAAGRVVSQTTGNGVTCRHQYNPVSLRLERATATRQTGTVLQDLHYDYDPVGNILSVADHSQPVRHFANQRTEAINRYGYDSLYQLIAASGRESVAGGGQGPELPELQPLPNDANLLRNYTQTLSYDSAGNLLELRHVNGQHNRTQRMAVARFNNRSLAERDGQLPDEAQLAARFDRNGNLLELQPGQTLEWDARNQLRQVSPIRRADRNDDYERYTYDATGARIRKTSRAMVREGSRINQVRYLPGLEVRTDSRSGEHLHVIVANAGCTAVRLLHWHAGKPDAISNDQMRYSLDNHLGSCTLEVDQQAQLLSREEYYPFGGTACWAGRNAVEAKYKTIRYSGKERDATGLYCYGLRYYAPWLTRWLNPDPAGTADGLNLYRMVHNNPIALRDTDGQMGQFWERVADSLQSRSSQIARRSKEQSREYEQRRKTNQQRMTAIYLLEEVLEIVDRKVENLDQQLNAEQSGKGLATAGGKRAAAVVLSNFGSWLGGAGGATLGAAFGASVTAGAGAAPGAVVGGVIGSKIGGVVADKVAEKLHLGGSVNPHSSDLNAKKIHKAAGNEENWIHGKFVEKIKGYNPFDAHGRQHLAIEGTKKVLGWAVPAAGYLPDTIKVLHEIYKADQGKAPDKLAKIIENGDGLIKSLDADLLHIDSLRVSDSDVVAGAALSKLSRVSQDTTMSGLKARVEQSQQRIASVINKAATLRASKSPSGAQLAA